MRNPVTHAWYWLGAWATVKWWNLTGPPVLEGVMTPEQFRERLEGNSLVTGYITHGDMMKAAIEAKNIKMDDPRTPELPLGVQRLNFLQGRVRNIFNKYVDERGDPKAKRTCIQVVRLFDVKCVSELTEQDCVIIINGYRRYQKGEL